MLSIYTDTFSFISYCMYEQMSLPSLMYKLTGVHVNTYINYIETLTAQLCIIKVEDKKDWHF